MKDVFIPLIKKMELVNGFSQVFSVNKMNLLLIYFNDHIYLLENKCGHFGIPLEEGEIEHSQGNDIIICKEHGISFNLSTGMVVNRPWENCDPLSVLEVVHKDDMIGFYI